jgi:hypothetical protein
MRRDLRPLAVAGVTAVLACGVLAVAVGRGWLGPDVGRGAQFCEAGRDGLVRQPANTFSNLGFVGAGLLIAWHAGVEPHRRRAAALACLVVLLGPGSAAMHATQSVAGGWLDLLSMHLVAAWILAYAVTRLRRGGGRLLAGGFAAGVAGCQLAGAWDVRLPVVLHPANAAFGLLLVAAVAMEVALMRREPGAAGRRYAYGAIAAMLAAFGIWNLANQRWCDPGSLLQGHAAWHLLGALSVYLLSRYYARSCGEEGTAHIVPRETLFPN